MKKLKKIIGFRFNSIEKIKEKLIELGFEEVEIYEGIGRYDEQDFLLDCSVKGIDCFEIWYLKDNSNRFLITEI